MIQTWTHCNQLLFHCSVVECMGILRWDQRNLTLTLSFSLTLTAHGGQWAAHVVHQQDVEEQRWLWVHWRINHLSSGRTWMPDEARLFLFHPHKRLSRLHFYQEKKERERERERERLLSLFLSTSSSSPSSSSFYIFLVFFFNTLFLLILQVSSHAGSSRVQDVTQCKIGWKITLTLNLSV